MESNEEPLMKKIKHDQAKILLDLINSYIISIDTDVNLKVVLSDELTEKIPLVKICAGRIKDATLLSSTLKVLSEKIPIPELQHLKRIHKELVILFPLSYVGECSNNPEYIAMIAPELKSNFKYYQEFEVFEKPPILKAQATASKWPLNFHPNPQLENLIDCESMSWTSHVSMMKVAFEILKYYVLNPTNFDPNAIAMKDLNATVVVDPISDCVVAAGFCNKNHPIQHSAMVAIDNVAKTQFGGAWGASSKNLSQCSMKGIETELLGHLLKQGVQIKARDYSEKTDNNDGPYLCTGYNVYTIREPCLMCSMALVHARVSKIFYCFDNKRKGGVNSRVKLQGIKALNHRFTVYTGFL